MSYISLKDIFNEQSRVPTGINYGVRGHEPLSLNACIKAFNTLAQRSDIAFNYVDDGCFARAHIMCRALQDMDVAPGKVWAYKGDEKMKLTQAGRVFALWDYHVAPCVPVRMPDKSVQNIILDPGIFDGPVTVDQWLREVNGVAQRLDIVPFGVASKYREADYAPGMKTNAYADYDADREMKSQLGDTTDFIRKKSDLMQGHKPPRRQSRKAAALS